MLHCSKFSPKITSFKLWFVDILKKIHLNITTNLQSLLYLCLLISGSVKHDSKFTCGNSLYQYKTLTRYLHRTMYTWSQYEKSISAWVHHNSNIRIQAPGCPPFLTLHHPTTIKIYTCPTKKSCSSKNFTQLDSLPSDLLRNIGMWITGFENLNKLKPVLVQLTQHYPVLCTSTSYKIKYVSFYYYIKKMLLFYSLCCCLCISSVGSFPVLHFSCSVPTFYAKIPALYAKILCYLGFYVQ